MIIFHSLTEWISFVPSAESLKEVVHTGNNKSFYLEKPLTFLTAGQVHRPIDIEPSSKTRANDTKNMEEILFFKQLLVLFKTKYVG